MAPPASASLTEAPIVCLCCFARRWSWLVEIVREPTLRDATINRVECWFTTTKCCESQNAAWIRLVSLTQLLARWIRWIHWMSASSNFAPIDWNARQIPLKLLTPSSCSLKERLWKFFFSSYLISELLKIPVSITQIILIYTESFVASVCIFVKWARCPLINTITVSPLSYLRIVFLIMEKFRTFSKKKFNKNFQQSISRLFKILKFTLF